MIKIIGLVMSIFALASCSIEGKWNLTSVTAHGCYSETNCVHYYSIPGKDSSGCNLTVEGTLTLSGETKGIATEDITYTVKCPGKHPLIEHVLEKNVGYEILYNVDGKTGIAGKTYIYNYKYNVKQEIFFNGKTFSMAGMKKTNSVASQHFAARGLKLPAYILMRYKYMRKTKKSR